MKFTYTQLPHQTRAVESVADIFDSGATAFGEAAADRFALSSQSIVSNTLEISDARILANIQAVQKRNGMTKGDRTEELLSRDFSVEMETGTGKTYVYIKTILTLAKRYGLTKFIILVPSVAIREGVAKSLRDLRDHLGRECGLPAYGAFSYDSARLSEVRDFAVSPGVSIMLMTVQSFNKDTNKLKRKDLDRFYGNVPIEMIARTRPAIIMDEPQNMESELSRSAIGELNALFRLRYSATHREKHNLVYSLSPAEALKRHLVKMIDVVGVSDYSAGDFVFEVRQTFARAGQPIKARVLLEMKMSGGKYETREVALKRMDDLYRKTKKNEKYAGLTVGDIDTRQSSVELSNGAVFRAGDERKNKEAVFRAQIGAAVKAHMEKQVGLPSTKVLSLFFVDRVDNYIHKESIVRKIFEETFNVLKNDFSVFADLDASAVHDGYFTKKSKTGSDVIDTTGKTAKDKDTFDLIMRKKERLLSFDEPVRFIFSHSALREGWDNPNIFQICTLQETRSEMDKRQKIGRGLRLPVDCHGVRALDGRESVLTVIANESYEQYVRGLQNEYRESGQVAAVPPERGGVKVRVRKEKLKSEAFLSLWEKIRKKTRCRVQFDEEAFVRNVAETFDREVEDVNALAVMMTKVRLNFDDDLKITTVFQKSPEAALPLSGEIHIGNIATRIADEAGITRANVAKILRAVAKTGKLGLLFENPEEFTRALSVYVKGCLNDMVINNGLVYTETGEYYDVDIFSDFEVNRSRAGEASEKSLFDRVVCDGEGERMFAKNLDARSSVKLFVKLPQQFTIDTPMGGTYNPDWAIVMDEDGRERVYLVRETKFARGKTRKDILDALRAEEVQKIQCGRKHFEALDVDFSVATQEDLSDINR